MAVIEGFRVRNYRALRDVTLGKVPSSKKTIALTPLTVVVGKNGAGKSTLFDAFGFISDCLTSDVETACDAKQRGGLDRLRSLGCTEPLYFEINYREAADQRPITYELAISQDSGGRPFVQSEVLKQGRKGKKSGRPYPFLRLERGRGEVWAGEEAVEEDEGASTDSVELTDPRQLGISTLGTLKEHPRIKRFRDFLMGWYLSYFYPDAARGIPSAGPQKHLNSHGDNLGNVVQYMEREHKERFADILHRIAKKVPGVESITTHVTEDRRVLLKFNDSAFQDPFYAQQVSDGTLKIFAYLLLLEDPSPPPFICVEEPENGLHPKLLEILAQEFRDHANAEQRATQVFITTHQPYFVDALSPKEVWVIKKDSNGFSYVRRVSDVALVQSMVDQDIPLGALWYSDYFDEW